MSEDPWQAISPPTEKSSLSAKRVDANSPWNFFWALGDDRNSLLILRFDLGNRISRRMPVLREIDISSYPDPSDKRNVLSIKLLDAAHKDIFYRLCQDIIDDASGAKTEREAVDAAISRTWRWHRLMRGARRSPLSEDEQRGLIGELLVLECLLAPQLSYLDALSAWKGPQGASKDFELERVSIEVKAHAGALSPTVHMSSEHQLDDQGIDALFLAVVEVNRAALEAETSFNVSELADRIRRRVMVDAPQSVDFYDDLLGAAGFSSDDDYSSTSWTAGPIDLYLIDSNFPRITPRDLNSALSNVRYKLSLDQCSGFVVSRDVLATLIKGESDAN